MKQPDTKTILGMECLGRKKAAESLGMSESALDKLLASTRARKAKVPIRFIQYAPNAPVWFPKPWLQEFITCISDAN